MDGGRNPFFRGLPQPGQQTATTTQTAEGAQTAAVHDRNAATTRVRGGSPAKKKPRMGKCAWVWAQFAKATSNPSNVKDPRQCLHCPSDSGIMAGENVSRMKDHLLNPNVCGFLTDFLTI